MKPSLQALKHQKTEDHLLAILGARTGPLPRTLDLLTTGSIAPS